MACPKSVERFVCKRTVQTSPLKSCLPFQSCVQEVTSDKKLMAINFLTKNGKQKGHWVPALQFNVEVIRAARFGRPTPDNVLTRCETAGDNGPEFDHLTGHHG